MSARYFRLLLAAFVLIGATYAAAEHVVITRGDLPPVVWDAFHKTFPHADTTGLTITYITEDTVQMYRLVTANRGGEVDALYMPSGRIIQTREVIVTDTLPEPVRLMVVEQHPRAQISVVERLLPSDGKTFYRLYLVSDDRRDTVLVSPEGTIIRIRE